MDITNKIKIGRLTALVSFLIGTGLFLSYYVLENDELLMIGYLYVIIAGIINLGVLIWLSTISADEIKLKKELSLTKKLILLNIPIAALYIFGVLILLSYMRITFVNNTNFEISDLRIIGCEEKRIAKIPPNQKTTRWISIEGDCWIGIKYIQNGKVKEETVVHYVSGPMGQRYNYRIGKDDGKF